MTGRSWIGATWTKPARRSYLLHLESREIPEPLSELENYTRITRHFEENHCVASARSWRKPRRDEPKKARMKAPFFTVLIDTYNYGEFIEEAVSSVLAQDFPAGAAGDSGAWMTVQPMTHANDCKNTRVRFYIYASPTAGGLGVQFRFRACARRSHRAAGCDDIWLPGKLGRVYEEFKRHPEVGNGVSRTHLWNGAEGISEDGYFIPVSGTCLEQARIAAISDGGTSCLAFKREALQKLCGAGIAAVSSRCLFNGADHFCGAGCGGDRIFGKIPAAWSKLVQTTGSRRRAAKSSAEWPCATRFSMKIQIWAATSRGGFEF